MKNLVLLFIVALVVFSCSKEEDRIQNGACDYGKDVVLKERNSDYPWVPYEKQSRFRGEIQTKSSDVKSYLGCGWSGDNFFDSYTKNITHPVVDTKRLFADNPDYYDDRTVNEGTSNAFSYSKFDEYINKSTTTKKISTGFKLNLKLFSLGAKRTMTEVFTSSVTNNSKYIFGELNIQYESSFYKMQYSSNIADKIVEGYLHKSFIEELYSTIPSELIKNYGLFVLTNFVTGGRATVLYSGMYKGSATEETKEKDLDNDINASYGFGSGSLGFGKKYNNGKSFSGNISSLNIAIKTLGGAPLFPVFTAPNNVENIDINMSPWLTSLSDKSNNVIIDIEKDGLVPILEFVLENNVREKLLNYIYDEGEQFTSYLEPYIQIELKAIQPPAAFGIASRLITRYGESIPLRSYVASAESVGLLIKKEKERLSQCFGVRINASDWSTESTSDKYTVLKDQTDLSKLRKVVDTKSGTIILLDDNFIEGPRAYTVRTSRIIDDYVMRSFINSIPVVQKSIIEIKRKYTIIAL